MSYDKMQSCLAEMNAIQIKMYTALLGSDLSSKKSIMESLE